MLCSDDYYGILGKSVTENRKAEYGLPQNYTKHEILQLVSLRCGIAAYSFQRYQTVTIARGVSYGTVSRIYENIADFPGIDISESYKRVYADAEYLAPLIGYTGQISTEELEMFQKENDSYTANDIVGKTGLESILETTLQGERGSEVIQVDNLGRVRSVKSRVEPQAGNDVFLTIDMDLQRVVYHILEQYIAGIIHENIIEAREFDKD